MPPATAVWRSGSFPRERRSRNSGSLLSGTNNVRIGADPQGFAPIFFPRLNGTTDALQRNQWSSDLSSSSSVPGDLYMNSPFVSSRRPFGREWFIQFCHFFLVSLAVALVLSVLAVALRVGFAEAGTWVPVGAPGGNVRALAADPRDPQRIYLGTADGILYRSDNGGTAWKRLSPGFPLRGCSLDEIVVDGRGVVFVGYWEVHGKGGGVARSGDGGLTFAVLKGVDGE